MVQALHGDKVLANQLTSLASEVDAALKKHAVKDHPEFGKIFAFEVDGFGGTYLMDDSNVPSLLSMPYLGAIKVTDPLYQNTRRFVLSSNNPFYFKGKFAEGVGGPHIGPDMIWPMAIIMQGLTSVNDAEIKKCIAMLKRTHADKGFMHESFHKDDPKQFTRSWFAWANTLFGEFLWKVYNEKPALLKA